MSKAKEFRDMTVDELEYSLSQKKKELYNLVNEQKRAKKAEKPHLVPNMRKEIAQLLTIMHEKQSKAN